jgi:hypothetical protein
MSRSTSQSSTATTNTSHGVSRSLSVKTNNKPQSLNTASTSDVRLFVTNLRLLDLDLRDDWPVITVQTFSAKNADQRQRIGGTEWALFRLFEIWDPNETAQVYQQILRGRILANLSLETPTVLPTPRAAPVTQPSCGAIQMSQRIEEEWRIGTGVGTSEDHAGRVQRREVLRDTGYLF